MQQVQSDVHGGGGDVPTGWAQNFNATFTTEDWSIPGTFHEKFKITPETLGTKYYMRVDTADFATLVKNK